MKRLSVFGVIAIIMSLVAVNAYAALDIKLTKGVSQAIPIAIVPFAGESNISNPQRQLTKIIKHDLTNSGQFQALANSQLGEHPTAAPQVDYKYWRKKQVDDVLVGSIKQLGFNQYQVTVALVDLYRGVMSPTKTLINQQFTVSKHQLRGLGHHISDLVFQKLTGEKGVFSTKIAYVLVTKRSDGKNSYALEIADMDGFNPKPLLVSPQPIMSPAWAPNGKRLAYVTFETKLPQIYVSNIITGNRTKITSFPGINGAPAWSPNGAKLAVALSLRRSNPNIYVVELGSGRLTQLTNNSAINTEPAWAPDGKSIIFTSDRGGAPQIYQVNLSTRRTKRLTFNGHYNASASFLPGGKSIVLLHREGKRFNIAVMDLKKGALRALTKAGRDDSPTVAPNGKMVAYATEYHGKGVLGMVSLDSKVRLRLPDMQGQVQAPAWSPFLGS